MSRRIPRRYVAPLLIAGVLLCAARAVPAGEAPATAPRESAACLECHEGKDVTLSKTPHRLSDGSPGSPVVRVACTDCHAGNPAHWEDDPEKNPMPVPAKLSAEAEARVCATCHQDTHQQNMRERNVHATRDVNCSGCHSVHGSVQAGLLKEAEPTLCYRCHTRIEGQFARPTRHPVNDGIVKCSECHMTLGETARGLSLNGTNVCMKCHGEFEGPFPYEHHATLDYSTEEGGCMTCHEPHGSALPRMLRQPYEPPHYQLCTQCHSVPKHNLNSVHGTRWSGVPCNDCHTDIHGSYASRLFLSETLQDQGCFNVGCHKF